jgi:hypothetical protein
MKFPTVCMLGIVVLVPFGLAFLLSPSMTGAFYGIGGWTEGTGLVARLFGVHLLYTGAANLAVMHSTDRALQRRFSGMFCALSAMSAVVCALTALRPGISPTLWSAVAIYVFFTAAWASIAFQEAVEIDDDGSEPPWDMR